MAKSEKATRHRGRKSAAELTEAEWEIMKVVWEKSPVQRVRYRKRLPRAEDWPTVRSRPQWTAWP